MYTRHSRTWAALAIALLGAFPLVGCGGGNGGGAANALAPQFEPQVVNTTDDFQFQVTGLTGVSQVLNYSWRNTGAQANVDQSCSIAEGTATLVLRDSTGAEIYMRDLSESGSFQSAAGAPSAWSMQVILSGVKGTVNFRAQKKT